MWQNYILARSLDDVINALEEGGQETRIIAGGTDLMLEMERGVRRGIRTLVDITRIPGLDTLWEDDSGVIHLGPMVAHNQVLNSPLIREKAFALLQACWEIGSPQIRNRGTIAGNLVTASPANDTISPLMALDAKLTLKSPNGTRVLSLADFYKGVRKTVLKNNEIITDISFKGTDSNQASYFIKTALRKAQAISVINISVLLTIEENKVRDSRITLGAVAPTIIHAHDAETFLDGKLLTDVVIDDTAKLVAQAASPISDIRGSADYRDYMLGVIAKRALEAIKNGIDKSIIPMRPVLLMGNKMKVEPVDIPWDGQEIHTWINGVEYRKTTGFDKTLLDFIREDIGLTGTKEGCGEGECGACTIYLDGRAVMSCLVPAPRAHGAHIVTIEGLSSEGKLHPVQESFVKYGAIQCGFCTPGFIMSAVKLLEEFVSPTQDQIKQAITGNLCRCTGYYKIIEAIEKASIAAQSQGEKKEE